MTYTPRDTVQYESLVKYCFFGALDKDHQRADSGLLFPDGSPLKVTIKAYMIVPSSASKKRKDAMLRGDTRPTKTPDVDNIAKIILDALNGIAYKDDAQVVTLFVDKYWSSISLVEVTIEEMHTA